MNLNVDFKIHGQRKPALIVVKAKDEARLVENHFRGKNLALAGNFSAWGRLRDLLTDYEVLRHVRNSLEDISDEKLWESTHSYTFHMRGVIGWSSTAPRDDYQGEELQPFRLNKISRCLMVRPELTEVLAPQTSHLTMILEFREDRTALGNLYPVIMLHSLYPGVDVGELRGDVTQREARVFFSWGHPGKR